MSTLCPVTARPGKPVAPLTVRSLVREERLAEIEGRDWFFCDQPDCGVVYFTRDGVTVDRGALKVRVGLKEKEPPRTVCYCFGHTVESIREEIEGTGRSTVAASIRERVEAGECSCEVLNPKGTCCLGDVHKAVREASSAIATARGAAGQSGNAPKMADQDCCTSPARGAQATPAACRSPEPASGDAETDMKRRR